MKFIKYKKQLDEMAYTQSDAINRCASQAEPFIDHFKEILAEPAGVVVNHWANEMQSYLNSVLKIVLKRNNKKLSIEQLIDWFFTMGSTVEVLFENDPVGEDTYNRFIEDVIKTKDVKQSLVNIGLVKEELVQNKETNEAYLDKEEKFYDYKTGTVNGDDIFDKHKTGFSYYDNFLNKEDAEYMEKTRNLVGGILYMTPNEYFKECASIFGKSVENQIYQTKADTETIEHLKEVINKYKRKFPLPYLNIATKQQEGRHRMYVAGELFGWDTRFPVLVVQDKDNIRVKTEPLFENKDNELKKWAKWHKKHSKGWPWIGIRDNAGNVPVGIEFFNNAMGTGNSEGNISTTGAGDGVATGGMGEELEDKTQQPQITKLRGKSTMNLKEKYNPASSDYIVMSAEEMLEGMQDNAPDLDIDNTIRVLKRASKELGIPGDLQTMTVVIAGNEYNPEYYDIFEDKYQMKSFGRSKLNFYITDDSLKVVEEFYPESYLFLYFKNEDEAKRYIDRIDEENEREFGEELNEEIDLTESEELDRKLFKSLVKLYPYGYVILNDGYFEKKIYADNDEDAIKQFREYVDNTITESAEDKFEEERLTTPRGTFRIYKGSWEDFKNEDDADDWGFWFDAYYPEDADWEHTEKWYKIMHNYKKQHAVAVLYQDKTKNEELTEDYLKSHDYIGDAMILDELPKIGHKSSEYGFGYQNSVIFNITYEDSVDGYDIFKVWCKDNIDDAFEEGYHYSIAIKQRELKEDLIQGALKEDSQIDESVDNFKGFEDEEEFETEDYYDADHASEWMERHPYGWYNSESDKGVGDEELDDESLEEDLIQSDSEEAFKKNVATEIKAGKPKDQALAIAYSVKEKNMKECIDIVEALNKLDTKTDNKYDLLNTYLSENYNAEEKKALAEALISNKSIEDILNLLK